MKAVILAGGLGTRISEESYLKPKPLIEIGGMPILWHIMKIYSAYGVNDFVICCGYKGYMIKEYFANYSLHMSDVTFDMKNNSMEVHHKSVEPWKVTLVDTGLDTLTGGRLKRIKKFVEDDTFHLTYGDTLNNVNITKLTEFHKKNKAICTLTACRRPEKFGILKIQNNKVVDFLEKPITNDRVNGGFFVVEPSVFDLIHNDKTIWEKAPLETLSRMKKLYAFKHDGFYQPMDMMYEKNILDNLWKTGKAPWKIW